MRSIVIGFGLMVLALLVLFRLGEVSFIRSDARMEVMVAIAAVAFFFIGVYFNRQGQPPARFTPVRPEPPLPAPDIPDVVREDPPAAVPPAPVPDPAALARTGLSAREYEVLIKLAEGMSNAEIAAALFLSESTVKTHVSNILFKLDVKRRTAAVEAARRLRLLA